MSQDHRAPGADVVNVALPVGIPKIGALGFFNKAGRAANGLESPHGRVHPAGDNLSGPLEKGVVKVLVLMWVHGWALLEVDRSDFH